MKPPETILKESPVTTEPNPPHWQYRSRSETLESVGFTLWSWMVVGGLSVWFCFRLVEMLAQLSLGIPH